MIKCDYPHCNNPATHTDLVHNFVCEECMIEDIQEHGDQAEDFISLEDNNGDL